MLHGSVLMGNGNKHHPSAIHLSENDKENMHNNTCMLSCRNTHTPRGRVEGWACHCAVTDSFHLMPVLSRQDGSRMKWITYRHHTSPGLSLWLLADLAEHRQDNVTLQFTSNMWSCLTEQDWRLQIRFCVSLNKVWETRNSGKITEGKVITVYAGKLPELISVQCVS